MVTATRLLAVLVALLLASALRADVGVGDTRDEVIRQHGRPTSSAQRGNREYFVYPKGGRIELVDGKVADVKGPLPAAPAWAGGVPSVPAAVTTPPASASTTPAPAPIENRNSKIENPSPAPPPATPPATEPPAYNAAAATAALSSHIDKMDNAWGERPPGKEHTPLDSIPEFIAGLLLRFGLTITALKLAFKYWEMDAFWKGIFAIAGIDLALHAIMELLGPATGGLTTMSALENGIPGLVLIYTINRFCFNKRLQNAVATAAAVKLVVTICYIFVGVAALNAAFG